MNIENIAIEFGNILGGDFEIYFNASPKVVEARSSVTKGVGIFKVDAGDIRPLPGVQGIEATCEIDYFLPLDDEERLRKFQNRLDVLISTTNGYVKEVVNGQEVIYEYVADFEPPVPVSGRDYFNGIPRQQYRLSVNVVLSALGRFGNNAAFFINGEELKGVVTWNELDTNEPYADLRFDRYASRFYQQFNTYKLSLTLFVLNDAAQNMILENARNQEKVTYEVRATVNESTITRTMFVERCSMTGSKGQFQTAELILAEVV